MPNMEQAAYWAGTGGDHWVAEQARYDRMTAPFGDRVVEVLGARPGQRVLDVGCGTGALSLAIGPLVAPEGSVLGLDISPPMLAVATRRGRAAGQDNVTFQRGDAQVHDLPEGGFDAVVSRFGVMFFDDPHAAFANLARSVRPGGRFVFACWQAMAANEWLVVPVAAALTQVPMPDLGSLAGPGPFSLAEPDDIRSILEGAGLPGASVEDVHRPMRLGATVDDTVTFMQGTDMAAILLGDAADDAAAAAWDAVRAALGRYAGSDGVVLEGAAWVVAATRP